MYIDRLLSLLEYEHGDRRKTVPLGVVCHYYQEKRAVAPPFPECIGEIVRLPASGLQR